MEASQLVCCAAAGCRREAIVFLSGRPLCYEHYVTNLNELHELGLTPRGLTESPDNINGTQPLERRVREPVEPPDKVNEKERKHD
jgi:hypothetical protein